MCPAFCDRTREVLIGACRDLGLEVHDKGTMVTVEGPRFSSLAESKAFRSWGCDVVNMTTVPEVGIGLSILTYRTVSKTRTKGCQLPGNSFKRNSIARGKVQVQKPLNF